jgi:hypothetical protein
VCAIPRVVACVNGKIAVAMILASVIGMEPYLYHKFTFAAWAAVTVAVVADDRVETSMMTSFYRFFGTVVGSIVGYLVMVIIGNVGVRRGGVGVFGVGAW